MSLNSSASLEGIAVFENIRKLEGKTFVFDAQFYVNEAQALIAHLRYFNSNDMVINDLGAYMTVANVVRPLKGATLHTAASDMTLADYHLVGDVVSLVPIDRSDEDKFERCLRRSPWVYITGLAFNINRTDYCFDVDAIQYTTAMKALPRENSILPIRTYFPNTPRFEKSKPMPS